MGKDRDFDFEDVLPESWTDALQEFVGTLVGHLKLSRLNGTTVRAAAAAGSEQVAVGVNGLWRWRTTNYDVAVSGGAGTKDIFVVAPTANKFSGNKDETERNWELRVTVGGGTPAGVAAYKKIGEADWSGTEITALRQWAGSISGNQIETGALSSASGDIEWTRAADGAMIANFKANSVGSAEIANEQVGTTELVNLAVTTAKVAVEAIIAEKIATGAVTEPKLGAESVAEAKLKNLAVTAAKLAAEAVEEAKLKGEAVSTAKIKLLAVTAAVLASEAVETGKIKNLHVTAAKLAEEAVETNKIKNLAVTAAKLAAESVETGKIKLLAITAALLAAESVETAKIKNAAVTDAKLASPNNAAYNALMFATGTYVENGEGTKYFSMITVGGSTLQGTLGVGSSYIAFYWAKADREIAGKAEKLKLRAQHSTRGVGPGVTLTVELYRITGIVANSYTLSAALASVAFVNTAANTFVQKESADFELTTDGLYIMGITNSGKVAASGHSDLTAQLLSHNV